MLTTLKNTLKGIVFTVILFALLLLASAVFIPKDNTKEVWKYDYTANGFLAEPKDTIDVLFLGDSEVFSGVSPLRIWEKYGITSYCCSTGKQRLWYTLEYLYQFLENQSPKVIFLETDLVLKYFSVDDLILHAPERYLPVLRYHDRWKQFSFTELWQAPHYSYLDKYKGYHIYGDANAANTEKYMDETNESANMSKMNQLYVDTIFDICKRTGAKFVLYSTPSTKNWNMKKHNRTVTLAEKLGVDYIDFNLLQDEVKIDWDKDTHDKGDHLNYYGAVKVSDYLGKYLSETGILKNHKGESGYGSWNTAFEAYKKDVEKKLNIKYE